MALGAGEMEQEKLFAQSLFTVGHVSPHYNHIKTLAASDVKHMDLIKYSRAGHKGPNRFD